MTITDAQLVLALSTPTQEQRAQILAQRPIGDGDDMGPCLWCKDGRLVRRIVETHPALVGYPRYECDCCEYKVVP